MGNDHSSERKSKQAEQQQQQHHAQHFRITHAPPVAPKVEVPPDAEVIGSYVVQRVLGKGSFAEVKLGQNVRTGEKAALKMIAKLNLNKSKRRVHLQREIRFMKLLSHPHIAALYDVIERDDSFVLIMEHAGGGELLEYIRHADRHRLPEYEARRLFRQIVSAVDYCHQNNLIHRDIKPENILLDGHTDIKIIDFGFSREFTGDMQLDSFIGSPHYAAPELLQGIRYSGAEVDIWSLGVLLYVMVCGRQPFKHPDMKVLYAKIIKGVFEYPDFVTENVKDLINKILQVDPKQRLSMEDIRNHAWMLEGYGSPPDSYIEPRPTLTELDPEIVEELSQNGFEEKDLAATLLTNARIPVVSFYHLLTERRRRHSSFSEGETESEHSSSSATTPVSPSTPSAEEPTVIRAETGERVPVSVVERNLRRQIVRRETANDEVLKRTNTNGAGEADPSAAAPMQQ